MSERIFVTHTKEGEWYVLNPLGQALASLNLAVIHDAGRSVYTIDAELDNKAIQLLRPWEDIPELTYWVDDLEEASRTLQALSEDFSRMAHTITDKTGS